MVAPCGELDYTMRVLSAHRGYTQGARSSKQARKPLAPQQPGCLPVKERCGIANNQYESMWFASSAVRGQLPFFYTERDVRERLHRPFGACESVLNHGGDSTCGIERVLKAEQSTLVRA